MNVLARKVTVFIIGCAFIINTCGCATPYMAHPEFKERHKAIRSASIMPPEVDAYVLTFKGDKKRLHELVPIMEKTTFEEIEKALTSKGYEIKKLDLSEPVLKANPNLRTSLFNVRKLFVKSLEDIAKRKEKKFTYSLGPEVNVFADLTNSDILVFVKEEGVKKSSGEVAKDVAKGAVLSAACLLIGVIYVPIPQTCATIVHIAAVDSNDGAILWYINNSYNVNWNPENQNQMARLVKSLINYFPDSAFKEKKKKGTTQKIAGEIKEQKLVVPVATDPLAVQH
ncbi:MAG: hypothetical protein JW994_03090 [Candidatus Omnitrophica bacterium]|nr:hypothetical protein [Candidatus Omnitrophota bacterium]